MCSIFPTDGAKCDGLGLWPALYMGPSLSKLFKQKNVCRLYSDYLALDFLLIISTVYYIFAPNFVKTNFYGWPNRE